MKIVKMNENDIINAFSKLAIFEDSLHKKLVERGKMKVDRNNDIEIMLDGQRYWVTTNFELIKMNECNEFVIDVTFKIKKDTKYGFDVLYKFTRTI